jgi:PKD repeat protein
MKGLLRVFGTGILTIAVAGGGLSSVLVAQAATNTPPVITSVTLTPDPSNEGDTLRVDVTFMDPDPDVESVTVLWSDGFTGPAVRYTGGAAVSFFQDRRVADDFPSNTPVDRLQVSVAIDDGVNPPARGSATVTLNNVAPVLTAFAVTPAAILVNQSATAAGSFSDPGTGDSFTLSLDWGDGSAKSTQTFGSRAAKEFSLSHLYLVGGAFTVTATVTDDDTGAGSATAPVAVTAPNTPPSDLAATAGPALEGGNATLAVTFVDPDLGDAHTASLDWGDGSAPQSLALLAGVTSFSPTHLYQDSGTYNATVNVADSAASAGPVTVVVNVANVGPTVIAENLSAPSIVEQESVTVDATFVDPGLSDTFTLTMSWGDGTSWSTAVAAGTRAVSASHQYLAAGPFVITVTVVDSDNASGSMAKALEVRARNRAPSGLTVTASSPTAGSATTLTGSFTDLDATDPHTVAINWADGSTGTVSLGAGVAAFSATHTYAASGTYHVNVTVTDPAGLATSATVDAVVQQKSDSKICELLIALEQRYAWLNDHDPNGYLARAIALLKARYGCGDEEADPRSSDQHGDMHAQVTVNTHTVMQSDGREGHSRRTER